MAKVNVNEFVIQLQHNPDGDVDSENSTSRVSDSKEEKAAMPVVASTDTDILVDLCVERVFQLLKEQRDR